MLAPEGTIADPGVPADEKYIQECRKFMVSMGKAPMEYLLTPRYKVGQICLLVDGNACLVFLNLSVRALFFFTLYLLDTWVAAFLSTLAYRFDV